MGISALLRALAATVVVGIPTGLIAILTGWPTRSVLIVGILVWATVSVILVLDSFVGPGSRASSGRRLDSRESAGPQRLR